MSTNQPHSSDQDVQDKSRQMIINDLDGDVAQPPTSDAAPSPDPIHQLRDDHVPPPPPIINDLLASLEAQSAASPPKEDLPAPPKEWIINDLEEPAAQNVEEPKQVQQELPQDQVLDQYIAPPQPQQHLPEEYTAPLEPPGEDIVDEPFLSEEDLAETSPTSADVAPMENVSFHPQPLVINHPIQTSALVDVMTSPTTTQQELSCSVEDSPTEQDKNADPPPPPPPSEPTEPLEQPLEIPSQSLWTDQPYETDKKNRERPRSSGSASILAQVKDEVDLWWGSYSSLGMLPSWLACLLLSAAFIVAAVFLLDRELRQLTIVGSLGAIWLVQLPRWLYRFLGYTYRLTTRRLYVNRGWLYTAAARVELTDVEKVRADLTWWGSIFKVGRVIVGRKGEKQPPMVLDAVRDPERMVKQIENSVKLAKEHAESVAVGGMER